MSDAADRKRAAEDLEHSFLVEAAAGTGKTTLLMARLLNVLCKGKARIDEIVAITFTEKAAGELNAKLREEIERALREGLIGKGGFERTVEAEEQQRLADALRGLDRAQVSTIHAFCGGLLRERPVEAKLDPQARTAPILTQSLRLTEAWETWRDATLANASCEDAQKVVAAMRAGLPLEPFGRGDSVSKLFKSLTGLREVLEEPGMAPVVRDEDELWREAKPRLEAMVQAVEECRTGFRRPDKEDKADRLSRSFLDASRQALSGSATDARTVLRTINLSGGDGAGHKTYWDQGNLLRLRELFVEIKSVLIPDLLGDLNHNIAARLLEAGRSFLQTFQRMKDERAELDFHDLLVRTRDLLRNSPEARRYFKDKFRFILVDEFQDTDPLQAEIVFFLAQCEGADDMSDWRKVGVAPGRLFLVGDPKQSIYRFRRADIEIYQECRDRLEVLRISENYRSGRRVVDFVNAVCAPIIVPPRDGAYQPEYIPLDPGPKADSIGGEVVLLYPPRVPEDQAVKGEKEASRFREGVCLGKFIQRAVSERWPTSSDEPLRYRDIAIVTRYYTGLEQYEDALRTCGVPYRIAGGKLFFERLEIKTLIAAATAIECPEDEVAVVATLRSALFGVSDEDLLRHVALRDRVTEDDPTTTGRVRTFNYLHEPTSPVDAMAAAFALLRELHAARNRQPIALTLQRLFDETKALVTFALKPQGEQRVANLMKVLDSARALEQAGPMTFRAFASWLREREVAREEEEAESPVGDPQDDFVQVMTIHKAKGLEFEMVIIADLDNPGQDKADTILVDRAMQRMHVLTSGVATAGSRAAREWDQQRRDAEAKRMLYVALTRAKHTLVLPMFWRDEVKSFQQMLHPPLPSAGARFMETSHLWRAFDTVQLVPAGQWPVSERRFRLSLDPDAPMNRDAKALLADREQWLSKLRESIEYAGQGAQVRSPSEHEAAAALADADRADATPRGRRFGILVHRALEFSCSQSFLDAKAAVAQAACDSAASDSEMTAATELVTATLQSALFTRLRAARRVCCEVPFVFDEGEGLIDGVIDVIAEEGDGLLIVDWKTDDFATLPRELLAHYESQLRDYAAAARAAKHSVKEALLYFVRVNHSHSVDLRVRPPRAATKADQLPLNLAP